MTPSTPEGRQVMNLFIRIHDIYISSPNCSADGFCHSQGAMYLSTAWHGARRGMDIATREAKIAEIYKQLTWLEANKVDGSFLCGEDMTLADLTWMPTCVFMEFLLPRVFGWADPFGDASPFPRLAAAATRGKGTSICAKAPRGVAGSVVPPRASGSAGSTRSGSGAGSRLTSGRTPMVKDQETAGEDRTPNELTVPHKPVLVWHA